MQKHLEHMATVATKLRLSLITEGEAELLMLDESFYDIEFRAGLLVAASYNGNRFEVETMQ